MLKGLAIGLILAVLYTVYTEYKENKKREKEELDNRIKGFKRKMGLDSDAE